MKIHDISMLLNKDTAEWPGDTPFQFRVNWPKEESGSVNVGKVVTSTHIGTHIDAPFHFDNQGKKVHELTLDNYVVQSVVIDVRGKEKISSEDGSSLRMMNIAAPSTRAPGPTRGSSSSYALVTRCFMYTGSSP